MIIVAAHGQEYIDRCLSAIFRADRCGHDVLVVSDGGGYDSGKYLRGFERVAAFRQHAFCFMQDSLEVGPDFFVRGFAATQFGLVSPAAVFPGGLWDSGEQREYAGRCLGQWGDGSDYDEGVFGPIFFCPMDFVRTVRTVVPPAMLPQTKIQQQAWERVWGAAAKRGGWEIVPLFDAGSFAETWGAMKNKDAGVPFIKHFPERK